jgi:hypothetical protein
MDSPMPRDIVPLFKDLVLNQDMAVPVAAMNALSLRIKVSFMQNAER